MGYFDPDYFDGSYFDTGEAPTATARHAVGQPVYLGRIEDDADDLVLLLPFDDF